MVYKRVKLKLFLSMGNNSRMEYKESFQQNNISKISNLYIIQKQRR